MRGTRSRIVVASALVLALAAAPARAADRRAVTYRAPVTGPVTDRFRPPATPYGRGNRGIDYATRAGEPVRAAAAGEVTFAGAVGNTLHVVLLHDDGIRTSYSFVRSVTVARGNVVGKGRPIAVAADSLHFGARAGDAYIDPEVLLAGDASVHLIVDGTVARAARPEPDTERAERAGVARLVWGGVTAAGARAGGGAVRFAAAAAGAAERVPIVGSRVAAIRRVRDSIGDLRDLADGIDELRPHLPAEREIRAALDAAGRVVDREPCTPADTPTPQPRRDGHVAVLVGGLGSASGHASVLDVDTNALGYAEADVVQFSYRGGRADEAPYGPADTMTDLRQSGRRLRELLERLQYERPGAVIDLIAHSQGGLVARTALGTELDPFDPRSPRIGTLITLATPHHGTDAATAAALLRHTTYGPVFQTAAGRALHGRGLDPRAKSIRQMAETSDYIRQLNRRRLPRGVRAVSIAARHDVVVPSPRSRLGGARNTVVTLPRLGNDHANLPGSAAARREMALALAGAPPTCEDAADVAADALAGHAIDRAERAATAAAVARAQRVP